VFYSCDSFPQESLVHGLRKVCSHTRGGLRHSRLSWSPADAAQAWGAGDVTATSTLGGGGQAQALRTQPEPGETTAAWLPAL